VDVHTVENQFDLTGDAGKPTPDPTFTMLTLETFEREIAGVARAIEMLDNGSYGSCDRCGATINAERLRADPLLVRCDAHPVLERPELFVEDVPTGV
jgi:RNA polymerase-binding transcription factor DksA